MGDIESGHSADGTFTVDDVLEEFLLAYAAAGDDAKAGDYYTIFGGGERGGCGARCLGGVGAEGEGRDACGGAEEDVQGS